jgi:hypothetical protein
MRARAKTLLLAAAIAPLAMAAGPEWLEMAPVATEWKVAAPALDGKRAALVLDTPALTRLRAAVFPVPLTLTADLLGRFSDTPETSLKIEWLDGVAPADGFTRFFHRTDGRVQSRSRLGDTTITRTVIASDRDQAVFIHLLANKPGALSFRVTLETQSGAVFRIQDRRQLISSPAGGLASHVWVLPFESDVATEGHGIAVRGEGEALVIWSFATGTEAPESLAKILAKLGERHDPGHSPPDPAKIWHGLLEARLKSIENSP